MSTTAQASASASQKHPDDHTAVIDTESTPTPGRRGGRIVVVRIARRLVRKLIKPAVLWTIQRQLRASETREGDLIAARGVLVQMKQYERLHQVKLIGRRNQVREW